MNIQNIERLSKRLSALGFEDGILPQLIKNISFKVPDFTIRQKMVKEDDVINFHLAFTSNASINTYSCIYYDAILRKRLKIPHIRINDIEVIELDKRMSGINWENMFQYDEKKNWNNESGSNWMNEEKVENIVTDLCALESVEDGKEIATGLKVKYWCDTEVEAIVGNLNSLKNKFEINQRFYLFDDEKGISVEEAYRFLQNRWMEKQLQLKKKQKEEISNNEPQPDSTYSKHLSEKKQNKKRKK